MTTDAEIEAAAKVICTKLAGDCCVLVHDAGEQGRHECNSQNCRVWPVVVDALAAAERARQKETAKHDDTNQP